MAQETTKNPFDNKSPFDVLEQSRRERLLYSISITSMPALAPVVVIYGLMWVSQPSWQIALVSFLTASLIAIGFLVSRLALRHKAEVGSYLFLTSVLLIVGINAMLIQGLTSVLAIAFATVTVIAGMLLGPKGGFVIASSAALLWLFAQIASESHLIPQAVNSGTLFTFAVMIITVIAFLFIAFMSQVATQDLRRALNDATYELIQTNRKLDEANRMKSRFLARTSHELRTPLNAIIGYTDLTLRRVYGSLTSMQEDGLRRVLSNAKRLQALINDILDLSKIEAGELELVANPFEIKSLQDSVEAAIGETARKKGLLFSSSVAPELPEKIIGDEIRTAQILLNLADNAVKYTAEGQVTVSIDLIDDTHWQIQVTDTGRGIREEDFGRIFEEFQQVDGPVPNMQPRGTGLGLAITRHLVHSMGGEITLSSELGKGSTFTVTLPLSTIEKNQTQL